MKAKHFISTGVALLAVSSVFTGCRSEEYPDIGSCVVDSSAVVDCSVKKLVGDPVPAEVARLTGYLCSGTARPDAESATYIDGAPQGIVCDDMGDIEGQGRGYCCNSDVGHCAYNPVADCPDETYTGYRCHGNRPDFLNSKIYCREGVFEGDVTSYCCRDYGLPKPDTSPAWCQQKAAAGVTCGAGLAAWQCPETDRPTSEHVPQNGSRSDFYAPVCSVAAAPANAVVNYCCFTPRLPPKGASCEGVKTMEGCAYGRFGFACLGTDKPSDYHPMLCNDPGVKGISDAGYPATLYCCDYDMTLPAAVTN